MKFVLISILSFTLYIVNAQPPVEKKIAERDSQPADISKSSSDAYQQNKRGETKQIIGKDTTSKAPTRPRKLN